MRKKMEHTCPLCDRSRWHVLWENKAIFVIDAAEKDWPGFIRVVAKSHTKEMSDFSLEERHHLYDVVNEVEKAVRDVMASDKVNLAQLGNMVPHVHWHVIARFKDDAAFPDAVWAPKRRETAPAVFAERAARHRRLLEELPLRLKAAFPQ